MPVSIYNQRGNVAIIVAIALVPMAMLLGLALDYAHAENRRQDLQQALDAALLQAVNAEETVFRDDAQTAFAANVAAFSSIAPVASFHMSETTDEYVFSGTASGKITTSFAQIIGSDRISVSVDRQVSVPKALDPSLGCIWVLAPWQTTAMRINTGFELDSPGCEINVYSNGSPAANINAGIDLEVSRLCIQGTNILNNYGPIDSMELGCTPEPEPISAMMPSVSVGGCDHNSLSFNGGTVTLDPGFYCGGANFNSDPDVFLNPGLYVIEGANCNVNGGTFTGNDVTFHFPSEASIQFNSDVTGTLTAPTSGPYENILFFEPPGLSETDFILNDDKLETSGLYYLPSRNLTVNSSGVLEARKISLVVRTVVFNDSKWALNPAIEVSGAKDFSPLTDRARLSRWFRAGSGFSSQRRA